MSPRFSSEDEILISEISMHGALYDLEHADYKDVNIKKKEFG